MTERVIRTTTADDFASVDMLLRRSYPALLKADYAPSVLVSAIPLISRARPELLTSGTYYLVEHEGSVVAAGGWTAQAPQGDNKPKLGHVRHLVTDHLRVRQGHARALMQHTFAQARAAGMERLECWSTLTAEPFYAAHGFARLEDIAVPIGPAKLSFPAVRMMAYIDDALMSARR